MQALTCDRVKRPGRQTPTKTGRAERLYARSLGQVSQHIGELISGFELQDPALVPTLSRMLEAYADALLPWARQVAARMLGELDARDLESWRSLGEAISFQLHQDLKSTPVGDLLRGLLEEQVSLIRSLPIEAARRVQELTLKGLEDSTRASELLTEIERSGDVTHSRATLIARTEVSRTASLLQQARATSVGITHYVWRTAGDSDVRAGHRAMQGKTCEYANPPAVIENGVVMHFHPGQIWNCRCFGAPVINESA